jgi:hypothetical protein
MAEPLDIDEMRRTLARVSIYRRVCDQVRASAGHTLFNGVFFLGIAYLNYNLIGKFHPMLLGPILIGTGEILVGLWKRVRPSPECVLLDALLQTAFVLSIVIREYLFIQQGFKRQPSTLSVVIGLWVAYDAYNTFQYYFQLRRLFVERPTGDHIAYVDDLRADVAEGVPESDPSAVDLPTKPRLKGKLLGDVAFFLDLESGELFLCARDEMEIAREVRGGGDPNGVLTILREEYPPFPLDPATWANYAKWKTAGGDPPPPVTVLPGR